MLSSFLKYRLNLRGGNVIIYRKNTWSDKGISFVSIMTALLLISNNIKMYKLLGVINLLDLAVGIVGLIIGGIFLYTSKMKYMEISKDQITWYTYFWVKHTLTRDQIKDIKAKTYYIIIVKQNNKEVWIPTRCVKEDALQEGKVLLKTYAQDELEEVDV